MQMLSYRGQRYRFNGVVEIENKIGLPVKVFSFTTRCAQCGEVFDITTPMNGTSPARRCKEHSRAGSRIRYEDIHETVRVPQDENILTFEDFVKTNVTSVYTRPPKDSKAPKG